MAIGSYSTAPFLAWAGWRLRIPGGPVGGQYKGFVAPDETEDFAGWPAGPREMFRPMDNPWNLGGVGIYPWQHWDSNWVGSPLGEGQTLSDFVFRSPAEVRPRPNASGSINVIDAVQLLRTPGFSMAPGNYRHLGGVPAVDIRSGFGVRPRLKTANTVTMLGAAAPNYVLGPPIDVGPITRIAPSSHPACPAWGCGRPPWATSPEPITPPVSPAPGPVVNQPPPPIAPQPAPITPIGPAGSSGCAPGQYRDAAGNCTSDWRNPYPIYLPLDNPLAPSPTVAASTCPTGYTQDPTTGNCLAPGVCPSGYYSDPTTGNCVTGAGTGAAGAGFTAWLEGSTALLGMNVPNLVLGGIGLIAAVKLMRGGRR